MSINKLSKNKILWISPYLPKQDGVAIYASALYDEIIKEMPVELYSWNYSSLLDRLIHPFFNVLSFISKIRTFTIIHVQYVPVIYFFHLIPLFIFSKKNTSIFMTVHEDGTNQPFSFFFRALTNFYIHRCTKVIVHTKQRKKLLGNQKKIHVIPYGISQISQPDQLKNQSHKILLPGFINRWKGHLVALKSLTILKEKFPNITLLITGKIHDKGYFQELLKYIHVHKLKTYVKMKTDWVPQREFEQDFIESQIVILPYDHSNMSGILTWTIAFNKPAVISNLKEFKEECGDAVLYADNKNHVQFANQMERLLKDSTLQKQCIYRLSIIQHKNSWKSSAVKTIKLYEEA